MVKPPERGGAVYAVVSQNRLTEVRHVHRSMLKPVPVPGGHSIPLVGPNPATSPDTEDYGLWVAIGCTIEPKGVLWPVSVQMAVY